MILDFDALLAEMPKEVSEAVQADIQQTLLERADRQDSEIVEYSAKEPAKLAATSKH